MHICSPLPINTGFPLPILSPPGQCQSTILHPRASASVVRAQNYAHCSLLCWENWSHQKEPSLDFTTLATKVPTHSASCCYHRLNCLCFSLKPAPSPVPRSDPSHVAHNNTLGIQPLFIFSGSFPLTYSHQQVKSECNFSYSKKITFSWSPLTLAATPFLCFAGGKTFWEKSVFYFTFQSLSSHSLLHSLHSESYLVKLLWLKAVWLTWWPILSSHLLNWSWHLTQLFTPSSLIYFFPLSFCTLNWFSFYSPGLWPSHSPFLVLFPRSLQAVLLVFKLNLFSTYTCFFLVFLISWVWIPPKTSKFLFPLHTSVQTGKSNSPWHFHEGLS